MLVGYEANNAMRNDHELGEYSRELISRLAEKGLSDNRIIRQSDNPNIRTSETSEHPKYRALLFSTRMKEDYRKYYSGDSNVSTYLPVGSAKTLPSAWIRYKLNPLLQYEKVEVFHGLNEELPYGIDDNIATVITYYGKGKHNCNSLLDTLLWHHRMKYSFKRADRIVAISEEVKQQLLAAGVDEQKIVVIGAKNPYEITDEVVESYYKLYESLV